VSKLTDPTMQQQKNNFDSKWRLDLSSETNHRSEISIGQLFSS